MIDYDSFSRCHLTDIFFAIHAGAKELMHDNSRPHVANMTKEAIQTHDWKMLPHPPYSPDLAPTDFHLF